MTRPANDNAKPVARLEFCYGDDGDAWIVEEPVDLEPLYYRHADMIYATLMDDDSVETTCDARYPNIEAWTEVLLRTAPDWYGIKLRFLGYKGRVSFVSS